MRSLDPGIIQVPESETLQTVSVTRPARKVIGLINEDLVKHTLSSEQSYKRYIDNLTLEQFEQLLIRTNGIVRDLPIANRKVDGQNVSIRNLNNGSLIYFPPRAEDKLMLLRAMLDAVKSSTEIASAANILYYGIQAIQLFKDGNTRSANVLYTLCKSAPEQKIRLDDFTKIVFKGDHPELVLNAQNGHPSLTTILTNAISSVLLPQISSVKTSFFTATGFDFQQGDDIDNDKLSARTINTLKFILEETGENYNTAHIAALEYACNHFPEHSLVAVSNNVTTLDGARLLKRLDESSALELIDAVYALKFRETIALFEYLSRNQIGQ